MAVLRLNALVCVQHKVAVARVLTCKNVTPKSEVLAIACH
jgi:hypothetical protein